MLFANFVFPAIGCRAEILGAVDSLATQRNIVCDDAIPNALRMGISNCCVKGAFTVELGLWMLRCRQCSTE